MEYHYILLTEKEKPWRMLQIEIVAWKEMGVIGEEGRRIGKEVTEPCMGQCIRKCWCQQQALQSGDPSECFKAKLDVATFAF